MSEESNEKPSFTRIPAKRGVEAPQKRKLSETELERITLEEVKAELDAQPKVTIFIPESEKDKGDVTVQINGYCYQIKRGVDVDVPRSVVKVLEDAAMTQYEQRRREDGEGNELIAREVPRFPFTVRI